MTQDEDRSVREFRQRVGLLYLLRYGLAALTLWAFLYGTAVLALRGTTWLSRLDLLWGLATLPLLLLPVIVLTRRRLPSPASIRAVLDRHGRCGGLLMAGAELPLGEWQREVPVVRPPRLRWRGQRSAALLSCGLAFVALAFLVPPGLANLGGSRLDIDREAEGLAKQLDVLEQEKVLDGERTGDLKASLEQVRREASGKDPVKTLESLDHLKDLASRAAQEAGEAAARKTEDLARAETFAEAMEKLAGQMGPNQLADAVHEMAKLVKLAADERELLESGLDRATLEALKAGTLTPAQARKLLEALKDAKADTRAKVGRLVKAKLLDAQMLAKCEKAGKCDCSGLAAFLKENGASSDLTDALALVEEPGRGGVTRGPGPARLNFGDESSEEGAKFKEEELPVSEQQSLKDSQLTGISSGIPQRSEAKTGDSRTGALAGARIGGGSASTQVVLPRHRGAVERYFERTAMPKK